jgi:hypothetical protein
MKIPAHVADRAEDWRWGNLWARRHGDERLKAILSGWPMERPRFDSPMFRLLIIASAKTLLIC